MPDRWARRRQKKPDEVFSIETLKKKPALLWGSVGGVVLVIGLVVFAVVRMMRGKGGASVETREALPPADAYAGLPPWPPHRPPRMGEPSRLPALMPSRTEVLLTQLQENSRNNPEAWANILRGWLTEEEDELGTARHARNRKHFDKDHRAAKGRHSSGRAGRQDQRRSDEAVERRRGEGGQQGHRAAGEGDAQPDRIGAGRVLPIDGTNGGRGGFDYAKRVLSNAFGPEGAKRIAEHLPKTGARINKNLESLQKADPNQLSRFIEGEHPQTIALILSHLSASQAASLLANPADAAAFRRDAAHRPAGPRFAGRGGAHLDGDQRKVEDAGRSEDGAARRSALGGRNPEPHGWHDERRDPGQHAG